MKKPKRGSKKRARLGQYRRKVTLATPITKPTVTWLLHLSCGHRVEEAAPASRPAPKTAWCAICQYGLDH